MTQRTGFVLHVRPERMSDYIEAHRNVWPDMLEALSASGVRNYTIFRAGNSVFGYFEADDLEASARYLADQEVCTRWQDTMADARADLPPGLTRPGCLQAAPPAAGAPDRVWACAALRRSSSVLSE